MSTVTGGQTLRRAKSLRDGLQANHINVILLIALVAFPWVASSYHVGLLSKILVLGILALSLDLMWGYAGILSFGHSALFALGAYALALTLKNVHAEWATYLGLVAGITGPGLAGIVLGYFVFYGRVSGVYFGIITLALSAALQQVFVSGSTVTGGDNGLYGFPAPRLLLPGLEPISLKSEIPMFYMALVGAVAAYLLARALVRSPFGQALEGIKTNEVRLESLGYNVAKLKMLILALSGAMAGFAGALYVPVGFVSPGLFGLLLSTQVIIWVAVGGRGTLIGAFVGAVLVNYLEAVLSGVLVDLWLLLVGVFLIIVVVFWPQGVMGYIRDRFGRTFIG